MLHSRPAVDEEVDTRSTFVPAVTVKVGDLDGSADRIHEVRIMVRMNCLDVGFGSISILNLHHIGFVAATFFASSRAAAGIFRDLQLHDISRSLLPADKAAVGRTGHVCTSDAAQVGVAQVGAAQVGVAQVGAAQVGVAQVGVAQVGVAQVGVAQVGAVQVGVAQVGVAQVGVAQVGAAFKASVTVLASVLSTLEYSKRIEPVQRFLIDILISLFMVAKVKVEFPVL